MKTTSDLQTAANRASAGRFNEPSDMAKLDPFRTDDLPDMPPLPASTTAPVPIDKYPQAEDFTASMILLLERIEAARRVKDAKAVIQLTGQLEQLVKMSTPESVASAAVVDKAGDLRAMGAWAPGDAVGVR